MSSSKFNKSLILAQDERWRRALYMQVDRSVRSTDTRTIADYKKHTDNCGQFLSASVCVQSVQSVCQRYVLAEANG